MKTIFNWSRALKLLKYSYIPGTLQIPASKTSCSLPNIQQICSSHSSTRTSPNRMSLTKAIKSLLLAIFVWREWLDEWEGIHWKGGGGVLGLLSVPSVRTEKEPPLTSCCQIYDKSCFNKNKWFTSKLAQAVKLLTCTGQARSRGSVSNLHCGTGYYDRRFLWFY
jgi:hypothetical protein